MPRIDFAKYDFSLIAFTSLAVIFGAFMVFSSSAIMADARGASPFMFFLKQLLWLVFGFAAMFITAFVINYKFYQKYAKWIYLVAFIFLIAVLIFGVTRGGAKRWLHLGFFTFQPSELAKFASVAIMASFIAKKKEFIAQWEGLVVPIAMLLIMIVPIFLEKDLGTPILIASVCIAMLVCAGIKIQAIAASAAIGIVAVAAAIMKVEYRRTRFIDYLNSFINIDAAAYQVKHALYAFGSGGFFGKGLGKSELKMMYLPEAHTDFIFPVIGEELGFLFGALPIMAFFIFIFLKGIKISKNAPDDFARYLALGITFLIVFQALINMSVATGNFPAKGLPLPFISFGGTSIVITMAVSGILINLSQYSKRKV
ncbi:putative lipid II flippase FtsW [Endomicrobium proavitum]|uniref:Probable peptidoglycan glycosyltransferase FtsW n=1 Tax=Endomicrobium proavitum TaxID=1408281 RepID=A0A0G3WJK4_9BACT|nr:putative lipid II flippase FtsW [Endomicrobium proavitum]AKL97679.1 putative cell division protein FtsW [Endomicrobium proavitum]